MPERPPALPPLPAVEPREPLGEGGMGLVRAVHDPVLERRLALKTLRPELQADPVARDHFLAEAKRMAQLQHPGVVPVVALGHDAEGRLGLLMQEVRGRTFAAIIADGREGTHRLVELLLRAVEAVAYAHSQGVVHRDLKPDNLMVGDFGEVVVLDWGLAAATEDGRDGDRVSGTAQYLAPEQALGEPVGPAADVYGLGATLHHLLSGAPPFGPGDVWEVLAAKLGGEVLPLPPDAPEGLARLVAAAMDLDPARRPPDAGAFAAALRGWLDDRQRQIEALEAVGEADALLPAIAAARAEAQTRAAEAAALWAPLRPHDPVEAKRPAWEAEDAAAAARAAAERLDRARVDLLAVALRRSPGNHEALDRLADHYLARHAEAEAAGLPIATEWEALLRATGRHQAWLDGAGELVLRTEPAGAAVTLWRWETVGRRRTPVLDRALGTTPIEVALPRGSWLLRADVPGYDTLLLSVHLPRQGRWTGAPAGAAPHTFRLLPAGARGPAERLIPAGPFRAGGDPEAADGLPAAEVWLPGFLARVDPVTVGEYAIFLNDLADPVARAARTPRPLAGDQPDQVFWESRGGLLAPTGNLPPEEILALPVTRVSWHDAVAYAAWAAARDGLPWRLPHELEWEKAGRGADARVFPWGDHHEPTWTRALAGQADRPRVAPVHATPGDLGPYGLRGQAGNASDWCANPWRRDGPPLDQGRLVPDEAPAEFRAVRGGHFRAIPRLCRLASRTAGRPHEVFSNLGFRLVRDWVE